MVLSQGLPQLKTTASLLGVVHADPAAVPIMSPLLFNTPTNKDVSIINMLGQGIIAYNICIGSLEQLLSSVAAISTQIPAPVQNVNGVMLQIMILQILTLL